MTVAVIDTNLLLSALINPHGLPATAIRAWVERRAFTLATCAYQLHELRTVSRRAELSKYIKAVQAGHLIDQLQALALVAPEPPPTVDVPNNPFDNFLLGCAEATGAHYLVSGDKTDVLALKRHGPTRIVTLRGFVRAIGFAKA